MPRRSHHQHRGLGGRDDCAALRSQCEALRQRVETLERQLRATANLHALLAANDRQLALCRARLERQQLRGGSSTAAQCEPDVEKRGESACTSAQERPSKRAAAVLSV